MDACCMLQLIKCRVQCPRHTLVWSKEYININTTHHILWPGLRDPITFLVSLYHHVLHTRPRNEKNCTLYNEALIKQLLLINENRALCVNYQTSIARSLL